MMDGSGDEESDQFFETLEEMASVSDSGSDSAENETTICKNADLKAKYEIWKKEPISIQERRQTFLREMGFIKVNNFISLEPDVDSKQCLGIERLRENSGAVLRSSTRSDPHGKPPLYSCQNAAMFQQRYSSSITSSNSSDGTTDMGEIADVSFSPADSSGEFICKIKNLDSGKEFIVDEIREDGMWNKLREVGTDRHLTLEEFERSVGFSPFVQDVMKRPNEVEQTQKFEDNGNLSSRQIKRNWLKALSFAAHSISLRKGDHLRHDSGKNSRQRSGTFTDVSWERPHRAKVHHNRKPCRELSALYMGQEIQAHEGSIWTMKFSVDGRYLASAGQDRVIHVREVIESKRKVGADTPDLDGTNAYLTVNGSPEVFPLSIEDHANNTKGWKVKYSKRSSNSDCIVLPDKVFKLSDKPLCSFHGHCDDVLDLSWSPSQYLLLSSSMDQTVRLWDLEHQSCLKIFSHSDYVTCIQFNPVDDRYFISGSLDGKVRIWSIPDRRVVDWSDIREMVTAACYTPDGQGGLVGSIKGSCYFYNTSGNKLQLETQVAVHSKKSVYSKKKSPGKKVTGFQFLPGDLRKVLITSADSRIRVFDGIELVCKYKGFRNTCSQISASFTSNGKHIVCASEDSNVYIWNSDTHRGSTAKSIKTSRSYEHFLSQSVLVAVPWSGINHGLLELNSSGRRDTQSSLHRCKDAGRHNGSLPRASGEEQELETALHYVSQGSHLSRLETLPDVNELDGLSRVSAHLSDSYEPRFMTFSASDRNTDNLNSSHGFFSDSLSKGSATWPEEKLPPLSKRNLSNMSPSNYDILNTGVSNTIQVQSRVAAATAWGLVIVTAGLGGEIKSFQNYGLPVNL
ncbi:hypothetical protein KI387_019011 [Taxus chinensis]|uniref:WD repeat-containing protein 44-like n=1 Tax=Taxus chinensis TaxID=29808 RepID=A0AA38LDU2_TAXCH|nr:hypothetical protein KI387_019011 [Taxus chinensis]